MFYRFATLLLTVISAFTYASNLKCRLGFGYLNGSEASLANVSQTYSQIFNELGESFKPADFQIMLESGKPFELPSSVKQSSETLINTLNEFSELVKASSLNGKEVEIALLNVLRNRIKGQSHIEQKQVVHDADILPNELRYPGKPLILLQFSNDGKNIVAMDNDSQLWASHLWGKFKPIAPEFKKIVPASFQITPEGKYAFIPTSKKPFIVYRAKVMDDTGRFIENWEPEVWIKIKHTDLAYDTNLQPFFFSYNGKWVLSKDSYYLYAFSPEIKPTTSLTPVSGLFTDYRDFRFMPNEETIIKFSHDSISKTDLSGSEIAAPVKMRWAKKPGHMDFSLLGQPSVNSKGSKAYAIDHDRGLLEIDLKSGIVNILPLINGSTLPENPIYEHKPFFKHVQFDPDKKYLYALVDNRMPGKSGQILIYDIEKQKTIKEIDLPHSRPRSVLFSPNKEVIVVRYEEFEGINFYKTKEILSKKTE